jgi:hypothetical protein
MVVQIVWPKSRAQYSDNIRYTQFAIITAIQRTLLLILMLCLASLGQVGGRAEPKPERVMQLGHNISYNGEMVAAYSPDHQWLVTATGNGALWGELIVWNGNGEV